MNETNYICTFSWRTIHHITCVFSRSTMLQLHGENMRHYKSCYTDLITAIEELGVRYGVIKIGPQKVGSHSFGRFIGHLHT